MKGVEPECFLGGDRRLAAGEEASDRFDQRLVAGKALDLADLPGAECQCAVVALAGSDAAKRADPTVAPAPGDQVRAVSLDPGDRSAAGAHDREQGLDAVDPVPEEVGVVGLELARSERGAADHFPELGVVAEAGDIR